MEKIFAGTEFAIRVNVANGERAKVEANTDGPISSGC